MLASRTMPALGPVALPPPYEYGTPRCESARDITESMACLLLGTAVATPGAATSKARLIATA
jgi:hypothetical protein